MIRQKHAGLDVSKLTLDFHVLRQGLDFHCSHCAEGFRAFDEWVRLNKLGRLSICLEKTGGLELDIALHLLSSGHHVYLVDGQRVAEYKQRVGPKPTNDRIMAKVLAEYLKGHEVPLWTPRPNEYHDLQELSRHRMKIVDSVVVWKNRLKSPHTQEFVISELQHMVDFFLEALERVEEQIRQHVASYAQMARNVELMCTVKSVSFTTAAAILAEAGPLEGYETPERLAMAAGLSPIVKMSGTSVNTFDRRPYGNLFFRRAISLLGTNSKRFNPAVSQFATRVGANHGGKAKAVVNRACARKMLHILWGVVKNQEPFDPSKAIWRFKPDKP